MAIGRGGDRKLASIYLNSTIEVCLLLLHDSPVFHFGAQDGLAEVLEGKGVPTLHDSWFVENVRSQLNLTGISLYRQESLDDVNVHADGSIELASVRDLQRGAQGRQQGASGCIHVEISEGCLFDIILLISVPLPTDRIIVARVVLLTFKTVILIVFIHIVCTSGWISAHSSRLETDVP